MVRAGIVKTGNLDPSVAIKTVTAVSHQIRPPIAIDRIIPQLTILILFFTTLNRAMSRKHLKSKRYKIITLASLRQWRYTNRMTPKL